jgi:hypothetical protein
MVSLPMCTTTGAPRRGPGDDRRAAVTGPGPATRTRSANWSARTGASCRPTATGSSARSTTPRTWCKRPCWRPGAGWPGLRSDRRCARGCTGSRPTAPSTCCATGAAARRHRRPSRRPGRPAATSRCGSSPTLDVGSRPSDGPHTIPVRSRSVGSDAAVTPGTQRRVRAPGRRKRGDELNNHRRSRSGQPLVTGQPSSRAPKVHLHETVRTELQAPRAALTARPAAPPPSPDLAAEPR